MTKKEAMRQTEQGNTLVSLGFTRDEAEQLRRISMILHRWHELECGMDNGGVERDERTGKTYWYNAMTGKRTPYPDRETGARKRLAAIIKARNERAAAEQTVCPNCQQWQRPPHGDCLNECVKRGFAPSRKVSVYVQGDPRSAALYIIRPGDVPEGEDVNAYYTRGIAVY